MGSQAIDEGASFIVLSDRDSTKDLAPIPSLLMLSAVHHHLIRSETRMKVGLVVEAGDVREVHHVALLVGYGASAVNPYLAMESCEDLVRSGVLIGAGAKILGRVEIGECAKIGAGSVVLSDVPAHTTVAGVPAVVVGVAKEDAPALDMDQRI